MWVSFVGGIGQAIVLAIIIGGAVALARATRHTPPWLPITFTVVALLGLIQPARRYSAFRRRQGIYAKEKARRAYVAIVAILVSLLLLGVMVWISRVVVLGK